VRPGEGLALAVSRWLRPLIPANYRSVDVRKVAAALVQLVSAGRTGTQVVPSGELQRF